MPALNDELQSALNGQLNAEMYSAYLYLAMAAYLESQDLPGFSHWMRMQSKEEHLHAEKLIDYMTDRGGRVVLEAIGKPPVQWAGPLDAFEAALAHEGEVTTRINSLTSLALEHKDHATVSLLRWFLDEQVEEEATVERFVKQLRAGGDSPVALLMLDRELATRPEPTAVAANP
jgi:ferritin